MIEWKEYTKKESGTGKRETRSLETYINGFFIYMYESIQTYEDYGDEYLWFFNCEQLPVELHNFCLETADFNEAVKRVLKIIVEYIDNLSKARDRAIYEIGVLDYIISKKGEK